MKKFLACTLALTMTAAVLGSCGDSADSSSKAETTTTTTAATTTTTAATTTAATTTTAESSEAAEGPKDISEMPATLKNYDTASIKFTKDTDPTTFVKPMAENDYDGTDESHVELSIEELAGVPMIKVKTLDKDDYDAYKIPKIQIDMSKLFEGKTDQLPKIFSIKMDVVTKAVGNFTADDGTESLVPGNFMGAFVTQPGKDTASLGWQQLYEFGEAEWTSEWGSYELVMRPGIKDAAKFVETDTAQYLTLMRWSIENDADFYIADIQFEDEDGNVIECNQL